MTEQEDKEEIIREMASDLGCDGYNEWIKELCDKLIRAGWRKY